MRLSSRPLPSVAAFAVVALACLLIAPQSAEAWKPVKKAGKLWNQIRRKPPTPRPAGNQALRSRAVSASRPAAVSRNVRGVSNPSGRVQIGGHRIAPSGGRPAGVTQVNTGAASGGRRGASTQWGNPVASRASSSKAAAVRGVVSPRTNQYGPAPSLNQRTHQYSKFQVANGRNGPYGAGPASKGPGHMYGPSPLSGFAASSAQVGRAASSSSAGSGGGTRYWAPPAPKYPTNSSMASAGSARSAASPNAVGTKPTPGYDRVPPLTGPGAVRPRVKSLTPDDVRRLLPSPPRGTASPSDWPAPTTKNPLRRAPGESSSGAQQSLAAQRQQGASSGAVSSAKANAAYKAPPG